MIVIIISDEVISQMYAIRTNNYCPSHSCYLHVLVPVDSYARLVIANISCYGTPVHHSTNILWTFGREPKQLPPPTLVYSLLHS